MNARDALAVGLLVSLIEDGCHTPFWIIRDAVTRKDVGSWCPATGSLRCRKRMLKGVTTSAQVLAEFGSERGRAR